MAEQPVTALEQLNNGVETLARAGRLVPCAGRPEWISEAADDLEQAAEACTWCPLTGPCLAAALDAKPAVTWGVWGSVDFGDTQARRAAQQAAGTPGQAA